MSYMTWAEAPPQLGGASTSGQLTGCLVRGSAYAVRHQVTASAYAVRQVQEKSNAEDRQLPVLALICPLWTSNRLDRKTSLSTTCLVLCSAEVCIGRR